MPIVHINSEAEFDQLIASSTKVVLVDFFATWCPPCRFISPMMDTWSGQYANVVFAKVDVDAVEAVAGKCGIRAMPTFQFFKGGKKVAEIVGANPPSIEAKIKEYNAAH